MKKYMVIFQVGASVCIEVEADNEDEAMDIAEEKIENPALCNYCAREIDLSDLIFDEYSPSAEEI